MFKKLMMVMAATASMALVGCVTTDGAKGTQQPAQPETIPAQPVLPAEPIAQVQCDANVLQAFMGKEATTDRLESIRQKTGAAIVRILMPNQPVTMEYNAERVNVIVNGKYLIQDITCG